MLLLDFVQTINKAITSRREKEIEADFKMNQVLPPLVVNMQIEEIVAITTRQHCYESFKKN